MSLFRDRREAGLRLAKALERYSGQNALVLGVPRGGLPVAAEVARALAGDLDVVVARKAATLSDPELALGAVTADGARYVNDDLVRGLGVVGAELEAAFAKAAREAREREERFRAGRERLAIRGRTVIVVDDGIATGATLRAAVRSVRRRKPDRLVAAVPVGAPGSCAELRPEVDELVALEQPTLFFAVGQFYDDFPQVSDEEVVELLKDASEAAAVP